MNKYLSVLLLVGVGLSLLVLLVAALVPVTSAPEAPQTDDYNEQWCEDMMLLPNSQWQEEQTVAFAKFCLVD